MVRFHIPTYLRTFTGGADEVELDAVAATAGEALQLLFARHPGVRDRVVDERGEVREHVNVFVNGEAIRFTGGLATRLPERCQIHIVPAVSGG